MRNFRLLPAGVGSVRERAELRLALGGCVSRAAVAVGKTKASAYRLRDRSDAAGFAAAWDRALDWGRARAFDLAFERALCGEEVPVMYRGRRLGTRRRIDNRLLMAVLNAIDRRRPARMQGDPMAAYRRAVGDLERDPAGTENTALSPAT